ncbi:MAG: glucose-6-phosphate isomerase [Gemmataceae bacterium]
MQLPDESVHYQPAGLFLPVNEEWNAAAELRSRHFLSPVRFKELHQRLMACRSQVVAEREQQNPPAEALPLEPGFINLPQDLLDAFRRKGDASDLGRVISLASRLREEADRLVVLGAGGSYLGAYALFQALKSAYHNELPPETRLGVPRIYFEGYSADNDSLQELLDLLQITCVDPDTREERWGCVTISKSGTTLEPSIALRVFRREGNEYYGLRSPWLTRLFAAVTSTNSRLREQHKAFGVPEESILTIPDNVGGRFSVFSPAGLLPAALMGLDVRALLLGAVAMTRRFLEEPVERNPVLQLAGVNYLMTEELGKKVRILSVWSRKLAGVGLWYEHLISETLGKQGRGPLPETLVQTRDLYTRSQQLQEGDRDVLVNHLTVDQPNAVPIPISMADQNEDDLNQYARKGLPDLMRAGYEAVCANAYAVARPSATIKVPALNEHTMGQLLQLLMLATVVEARLMGLNPYSRPGLEMTRRSVLETLKTTSATSEPSSNRPGSNPDR